MARQEYVPLNQQISNCVVKVTSVQESSAKLSRYRIEIFSIQVQVDQLRTLIE